MSSGHAYGCFGRRCLLKSGFPQCSADTRNQEPYTTSPSHTPRPEISSKSTEGDHELPRWAGAVTGLVECFELDLGIKIEDINDQFSVSFLLF